MFHSRYLTGLLTLAILGSFSFNPISAQESEKVKAFVAIEVDYDGFLKSKLFEQLGGMKYLKVFGFDDEAAKTAMSYSRFGIYIAPPQGEFSPEELMSTPFLVTVVMKNEDAAKKMEDRIRDGFVDAKLKGKSVLKASGPGAPPVYAFRDSNTLTFGSESFLFADPKTLMGKRLGERMQALDSPWKMAVDFDLARDFLTKVSKKASEEFDLEFMTRQYVELLDEMSIMEFEMSWDENQDIFRAKIEGRGADETKKIKLKIDAAVGLLKGFAELGLKSLESEAPSTAKLAGSLLEGLKVESNDREVKVSLGRPKELPEQLKKSILEINSSRVRTNDANRMRQVTLAMHNYHSVYKSWPFKDKADSNLSWKVKVLPFIERTDLYEKFDLEEKWSSEQNRKLINQCPDVFAFSSGATPSVIMPARMPANIAGITDGTANTAVFVENPGAKMTPWTQPHGISVDEFVNLVSSLKDGKYLIIGMYDGSVRRISNKTSKSALRRLADPADGEILRSEEIK